MNIELNEKEKAYLKEFEKLINNKEIPYEEKLIEAERLFKKYFKIKKRIDLTSIRLLL